MLALSLLETAGWTVTLRAAWKKSWKFYIRNLESVQQDVRIFRHDFKNRMAGIRLRADEGDLEAVQEFLAEVTGDFEKKVGEKFFRPVRWEIYRLWS